jgi:cyclase
MHGVIGVAAGSLFVFKGPYNAVLINYPTKTEKNNVFKINKSGNTK